MGESECRGGGNFALRSQDGTWDAEQERAGGEGRWSSGHPLFTGSLCAVGANMPCDLKGDMGSLS